MAGACLRRLRSLQSPSDAQAIVRGDGYPQAVHHADAAGMTRQGHQMAGHRPHAAITAATTTQGRDPIVIAVHGWRSIGRLRLGSGSRKVPASGATPVRVRRR